MVGKHIRRDALKYYKMGKIPLGRPYWVRGDFRVKTVVPIDLEEYKILI